MSSTATLFISKDRVQRLDRNELINLVVLYVCPFGWIELLNCINNILKINAECLLKVIAYS